MKDSTQTVPVVADILVAYSDVFDDHQGLSPTRTCDHKIPLKEDAMPPNIQPY
jgi:hypothetical protein